MPYKTNIVNRESTVSEVLPQADLSGVDSYQKMTHFPKNETLKNFCYKPGTKSGYSEQVHKAIYGSSAEGIAAKAYCDREALLQADRGSDDTVLIMAVCLLPEPPPKQVQSEFHKTPLLRDATKDC